MSAANLGTKVSFSNFYDRRPVQSAQSRAKLRVGSRFGAFVRRSARSSIRRRLDSSRPGSPPTNVTGLLRRLIFFSYDRDIDGPVIGPTRAGRSQFGRTGAEVLEFGGPAQVTRFRRDGWTDQGSPRYQRVTTRFNVAARPFMLPALQRESKRLPSMWTGAVR